MQARTTRHPSAPVVRIAVGLVLFAVAVAQGADLLTFLLMMHAAGPAFELNPLARHAAESGSYVVLILAKIALVVLVSSVYAILARRRVALPSMVAWFGVAGGIVGAFSNMRVLLLI
jgi:hypothetical protein